MTRARQDRAKRVMLTVAAACLVAAAAPAVDQVVVNGWGGFLARPAGVGASHDAQRPTSAALQVQAPPAPRTSADDEPAQAVPPPSPPPKNRPPRFRPRPAPPVVAAPPMRLSAARREVVHRRR